MAVHHAATIVPTKLELLQTWVPHQPWLGGADTSTLTKLGSYRFDDPHGEVGMETHLLGTADGQVLQVPLTYRGATRTGGEGSLITTMTHTTLGDRWTYDGCHDTGGERGAEAGRGPARKPLSCWRPWTVRPHRMCVRCSDHQQGSVPSGAGNRAPMTANWALPRWS